MPEVLEHPQVVERGLVTRFPRGPGRRRATSPWCAPGFRLPSGDPAPARPPPPLGADNAAILGELGCGAADIEALRAEGVI